MRVNIGSHTSQNITLMVVMTTSDALSDPSVDLEPRLIDMAIEKSDWTYGYVLVNDGNVSYYCLFRVVVTYHSCRGDIVSKCLICQLLLLV